jgi:hypothetical protein
LLAGLSSLTQVQQTDITMAQIKQALREHMEETEELPSPHWIAARLRTLDLIEKKTRYGSGRRYTIPHARVQDRQRRYQLI